MKDSLKIKGNSASHSSTSLSESMSKVSISSKSNENIDTDDIDENDESGQNILLSIIAQLKPGCDLSKITLPTFILEKKSMLERITNQLQFPDIVLDAHQEKVCKDCEMVFSWLAYCTQSC